MTTSFPTARSSENVCIFIVIFINDKQLIRPVCDTLSMIFIFIILIYGENSLSEIYKTKLSVH